MAVCVSVLGGERQRPRSEVAASGGQSASMAAHCDAIPFSAFFHGWCNHILCWSNCNRRTFARRKKIMQPSPRSCSAVRSGTFIYYVPIHSSTADLTEQTLSCLSLQATVAERDDALTQKNNNLTDLQTALAGREAEIASLQVEIGASCCCPTIHCIV